MNRSDASLDDDDLFVLVHASETQQRIERMLHAVAAAIFGDLDEPDSPDAYEIDEDRLSSHCCRRTWVVTEPPEMTWISQKSEGSVYVMISDAEFSQATGTGTPTVYAGLSWKAGQSARRSINGSAWEAAAQANGLAVFWEGSLCNLLAATPLGELLDPGATLEHHSHILAKWAQPRLVAALRLDPPPPTSRRGQTRRAARAAH